MEFIDQDQLKNIQIDESKDDFFANMALEEFADEHSISMECEDSFDQFCQDYDGDEYYVFEGDVEFGDIVYDTEFIYDDNEGTI